MLFSDVLTLVVALVVIAALGWTVARLWGPIADYVRYDRGGEEH